MSRPLRLVLVYHGVGRVDSGADPMHLIVTPEHLQSHVRLLRRLGYRFRTAEELLDSGPLDERTAVLTFDDGWRNWITAALPVLDRLGVRATFYVCPGLWGERQPDVAGEDGRLMDAREASALVDAGMELGSHSLSHPDLRVLDDDRLHEELVASKTAVEELTGQPCRTLAYPFGFHDDRVRSAAAAAGYEAAFGWQGRGSDRFALPRLPPPPRGGAALLALKLLGLRRRRR